MITKAKVNPETIKGLADEELESLVYEKASQLHFGTFGERFTQSPEHVLLCEIYSTAILDGEVRNGGFDQFFYQKSQFFSFALEGLKKIGAYTNAGLLARAAPVYEAHQRDIAQTDAGQQDTAMQDGGQDEHGEYVRSPELDAIDSEYYVLEDIYPLRVRFIRENIEKFFD
jgi:Domain of unknown function (DUF4375)